MIMIIIIIITRQVLGRPVCDRGAIPRTLVQSNVVRSRIIILINEEINEVNWMVSNSAKLDRRTKQHTQFGVSASNGSRDMARTKSWQKKKYNEANWMVSNSAKLDRRTKQHTQFGVSASNGSRDMGRTKSWRKKKRKKNECRQSHIASPTGIANNKNNDGNNNDNGDNNDNDNNNNNNETGSRSPCMRPRSDPPNFGPIERGEKQNNNID